MATDTSAPVHTEQRTRSDREHEELNRLFYLYRLASLNQRYYGCRADKYERLDWGLTLTVGAASAIALGALLLSEGTAARTGAAVLAGFAAVLTGVSPLLGWTAKAKRFCNLHFSYGQLFSQIESVIFSIRREGLTDEAIGASKLVQEAYNRMHALDELQPVQALIDRETAKVREAFPEDYIWTRF
jgi:hypothetical protein